MYLLKEKKEAFYCFEKSCTLSERKTKWKVNIIRIDGGGEYNSKEFSELCVTKGIEHEVTTPYTPQHNGLAKSRNKTLLNIFIFEMVI